MLDSRRSCSACRSHSFAASSALSSGHRPVEFKPMYNYQLQVPVRCSTARMMPVSMGWLGHRGDVTTLIAPTPPPKVPGARAPAQTPPVTGFTGNSYACQLVTSFKRRLRLPSKSFPGGPVCRTCLPVQEPRFDPGSRIPWRRQWQPHSGFFPEIPRTEEPGRLQPMGCRVGHN